MVNRNSKELMHYGVMGMHWGVRRYQPYGEGGYDPKHKGKFVGRKEKKANYNDLRKNLESGKGIKDTEFVKKFKSTDDYKRMKAAYRKERAAANKSTTYEGKANAEMKRTIRQHLKETGKYDFKPTSKQEEYMKKQQEYHDEAERLSKEGSEAIKAAAKKYIKQNLGRYRNKKVNELYDYHGFDENEIVKHILEERIMREMLR